MGNTQAPEAVLVEGIPHNMYRYKPSDPSDDVISQLENGCAMLNAMASLMGKVASHVQNQSSTTSASPAEATAEGTTESDTSQQLAVPATPAQNRTQGSSVLFEGLRLGANGKILFDKAICLDTVGMPTANTASNPDNDNQTDPLQLVASGLSSLTNVISAVSFALSVVIYFVKMSANASKELDKVFNRSIDLNAVYEEITKVQSYLSGMANGEYNKNQETAMLLFDKARRAEDQNLTDERDRYFDQAFLEIRNALSYAITMARAETDFNSNWLTLAHTTAQLALTIHMFKFDSDHHEHLLKKIKELNDFSPKRIAAIRAKHLQVVEEKTKEGCFISERLVPGKISRFEFSYEIKFYDTVQGLYFTIKFQKGKSVTFINAEDSDMFYGYNDPHNTTYMQYGGLMTEKLRSYKEFLKVKLNSLFYKTHLQHFESILQNTINIENQMIKIGGGVVSCGACAEHRDQLFTYCIDRSEACKPCQLCQFEAYINGQEPNEAKASEMLQDSKFLSFVNYKTTQHFNIRMPYCYESSNKKVHIGDAVKRIPWLYLACQNNMPSVVRSLLKLGADPLVMIDSKSTVLHVTASKLYENCVKAIFECVPSVSWKALVEMKNSSEKTAADEAADTANSTTASDADKAKAHKIRIILGAESESCTIM